MDKPYALSWPLSAFSIAALRRQIDRRIDRTTEIQLVEIEQPDPVRPVTAMITSGKIRCLRTESVAIAGKAWIADKFQLDAFMSSLPRKSLLCISEDGILLKLEAQSATGYKERLELTRFDSRSALPR